MARFDTVAPQVDDPFGDVQIRSTPRGHAWIAWLVIALIVTVILLVSRQGDSEPAEEVDRTQLLLLELQGKYIVGAAQTPMIRPDELESSIGPLNSGPLENRLCYAILIGELKGSESASESLERTVQRLESAGHEPPAEVSDLLETLKRLYSDYGRGEWNAPSVSEPERESLIDQLGWFGELALTPPRDDRPDTKVPALIAARRTFVIALLGVVGVVFVMLAGAFGCFAFLGLASTGRLHSSLGGSTAHGGIYAETFAVWMVSFFVLSLVAGVVFGDEQGLAPSILVMFASLAVLGWPVWRGLSWPEVRRDIGLIAPRGVLREVFWGLVCYVSSLPLVAIGFVLTAVMIQIQTGAAGTGGEFGPTDTPTHPIVSMTAESGWLVALQVLLVAAVAAPVVEETMFRGVLYRHLRDATASARIGWSILVSALINSLVFAVIHPQGMLAIPPLTALAIGFTLAREWRGSLLAPMTAHAVHNGILSLILLFVL